MTLIGTILSGLISLYLYVLVARAVLSIVPLFAPDWRPKGVVLVLAEAVYTVTDPPLRALGRVVKPVRLGTVSLDLGFILLWVLLLLAQRVVYAVFW
ncbi:YggT family protein [Nigerium sp.]|uniref:YggT family protein n=1 Tax=Nigerium sp. TaxID=2042655 RepID=UPI003221EC56